MESGRNSVCKTVGSGRSVPKAQRPLLPKNLDDRECDRNRESKGAKEIAGYFQRLIFVPVSLTVVHVVLRSPIVERL
jgi:hypothetical protein